MAIKKDITIPNGLTLNYHRIALVNIEPNQRITILRHSYLNESSRDYEKQYEKGEIEGEPNFPYVDYEYMTFDYDENICMKNAYELLKSLPMFEGAEDV